MNATEVERQIGEEVRGNAADRWNGMATAERDEYIILAQREGVEVALEALDD
jgi:hypothetical protein